jgi:hypothetical protein
MFSKINVTLYNINITPTNFFNPPILPLANKAIHPHVANHKSFFVVSWQLLHTVHMADDDPLNVSNDDRKNYRLIPYTNTKNRPKPSWDDFAANINF